MTHEVRPTTLSLPRLRRPAAPSTNDYANCAKCEGKGWIYVPRPYILFGRNYGDMGGIEDCPVCQSHAAHCEVCGDFGYVRYDVPSDHPLFGQLHPCAACPKGASMSEAILTSALKDAGLPEFYRTLSFQSWMRLPAEARHGKELPYAAAGLFALSWEADFAVSLKAIYEKARLPWERGRKDRIANSLVFEGEKGIGKTGLVAAVCNYLVEKTTVRPLYIRCRNLIRAVQTQYGTNETTALERCKSAELLVIDEMNLAKTEPDKQEIMEEIVRYRHDNGLPTLITLNTTRAEFEAEWGQRTATVAYEMSHWIVMTGSPIRDEGAAIGDDDR